MGAIRHTNLFVVAALLLVTSTMQGQDWKILVDLRGKWKIELGDNARWAELKFDDSKWDNISVPSPWEDDGFPGYDGYAWYRKHFTIDKSWQNRVIYLHLGYVDDVCEVYLNGNLIGFQGEFPPSFNTAYNVYNQYIVPLQYLNFDGDNVVAVRVFDQMLAGGITRGDIGLFEPLSYLQPDYNLAGTWKFITGDDESWMDPATNDMKWKDVIVPAYWEGQGFKGYDGLGWYRMRFRITENLARQRLILLLGKIDDVDETYVNGKLVGRTGRIHKGMNLGDVSNDWQELRAYVLPSDLLSADQENVIAVRVNDVYLHGGIYDGPVGLVTRGRYLKWTKGGGRKPWNILDWFK